MTGNADYATGESTRREVASLPTVLSGLILLIVGGLWLLDIAGILDVTWTLVGSVLLILIGVLLIAAARHGSHGGMIFLGIVLSVVVLFGSLASFPSFQGGVGDRVTAPGDMTELEESYSWGAGSQEFDLRGLDFPTGETEVQIRMGMGDLQIRVPDNVAVRVDWSVGLGDAQVLDRDQSGISLDGTHQSDDYEDADQRVFLDIQLGMGALEVGR